MAASRSCWLVALAGMAMMGAGCGSSGNTAGAGGGSSGNTAGAGGGSSGNTAGAGGASRPGSSVPADPAAVSVIRAWSTALRRGDVAGAARFFALPSEFVNAGQALTIHTEADARAANASLPCGAILISTERRGHFVRALFRLTNRLGSEIGCGQGTGQLASTDFVIAGGHIVEWIRAPDNSGGASSPSPTPAAPSTPQGGGPVV